MKCWLQIFGWQSTILFHTQETKDWKHWFKNIHVSNLSDEFSDFKGQAEFASVPDKWSSESSQESKCFCCRCVIVTVFPVIVLDKSFESNR